jgi:hypothetical protein
MLGCGSSFSNVPQPEPSDGAVHVSALSDTNSAFARSAIDELFERYVSWHEECQAVRVAYRRWADSGRGERRLSYAVYLAALDREQVAASTFADHVERVRRIAA